jgi:hypothetical protein
MDPDTGALSSTGVTADDDVGRMVARRQQTPKARRTAMTYGRSPVVEHRAAFRWVVTAWVTADRKNRRHPPTVLGQRQMAHCVNASVHSVQATRIDAPSQGAFADAHPTQLADRDNSVLLPRDLRDQHVGSGDFPIYSEG